MPAYTFRHLFILAAVVCFLLGFFNVPMDTVHMVAAGLAFGYASGLVP